MLSIYLHLKSVPVSSLFPFSRKVNPCGGKNRILNMKDKRKNYVGKRSILTKIAMRRKSMNRKDKEIHQDRQRNKNNNK